MLYFRHKIINFAYNIEINNIYKAQSNVDKIVVNISVGVALLRKERFYMMGEGMKRRLPCRE